MRKSVEEFIKQCVVCQQTKYSTDAPGGYLQPLPTPSAVWEDVLMDFITGLQASRGITVILVVVDRLTKYAHFGTLPTSFNAHKVAEVFLEIVVKHHGIPRTIVSDHDPIFVSTFWKQLFHFSGDMVLVKLQPYRQITLAKRLSHKLAKRYYGPYKVGERVGKVAYRLALHVTSKIHLVFHVSILKAFVGNGAEVVTEFPEEFQDGQPVEQPLAVCGNRMVLRNRSPVKQILVRWAGGSLEEATWEWLPEFQTAYPAYNLEDKVIFEDGGNDSPLEDQPLEDHDVRTSKRVSVAPAWHKDFVVG
ncbi:ty3-gypsy retrotransposon protein [Tanacetum coccineum]